MSNTTRKTGWVIKHADGHRIWKEVYFRKEDAERELRVQIAQLKAGQVSNWKVEAFNYATDEEASNIKADKELDEFVKGV